MNSKRIFSLLLLLFGEALIIWAFIHFRGSASNNVLTLNIIVSSIIYSLFFIDILVPWIDLNDKSQRRVGSIGVRWFVTWTYASLAVALMLFGNEIVEVKFSTQLIVHAVLFFFLLLGLLGAVHSSGKVRSVHEQETANRSGINELKKAIGSLKDRMNDLSGLPEYLINRVNALEEGIRFISPSNNPEAYEMEDTLIKTINDISYAINNFSMNEEVVELNLRKCERIYQNRKKIYSN